MTGRIDAAKVRHGLTWLCMDAYDLGYERGMEGRDEEGRCICRDDDERRPGTKPHVDIVRAYARGWKRGLDDSGRLHRVVSTASCAVVRADVPRPAPR